MNPVASIEFQSMRAVARWLDNNERVEGAGRASETEPKSPAWDFKAGWDGALEIASKGGYWAKGAAEMKQVHAAAIASMSRGPSPEWDYDITGVRLDVPTYCGGDPAHWVSPGEDETEVSPIIRIGVNTGRVYSMTAKQIMHRGAAILSLVDSLESQGKRVELIAHHRVARDGKATDIRTVVKGSDSDWNPHTAAFALAHPAFSRRLMFGVIERFEDSASISNDGYGSYCPDLPEGYTCYFNGVYSRLHHWDSVESAVHVALETWEKSQS